MNFKELKKEVGRRAKDFLNKNRSQSNSRPSSRQGISTNICPYDWLHSSRSAGSNPLPFYSASGSSEPNLLNFFWHRILMFSRFRKPSATSGYFPSQYSKHRNRDKVQKITTYDACGSIRNIMSFSYVTTAWAIRNWGSLRLNCHCLDCRPCQSDLSEVQS